MILSGRFLAALRSAARIAFRLASEAARFVSGLFRARSSVVAENLFLRKQLALYQEREAKRPRADTSTRLTMALLSMLFSWQDALVIVQPRTLVRWHRSLSSLIWRWRSKRAGRPPIPDKIGGLIKQMAAENPTWSKRRIQKELALKLGVTVSPETVAKYLNAQDGPRSKGRGDQRWATFVRHHAKAIVACDLFTVVTSRFLPITVLVIMELGRRKILHWNVTTNPRTQWTQQQFREAIPCDHDYRFVIHDRDEVFSSEVDEMITGLGVRVLKTPYRSPRANTFCERLIGTCRRECLDYLIPLNENHLRMILREWVAHYNEARPHTSLGPGIPDPPAGLPVPAPEHRHRLPVGFRVVKKPVLSGLHHEYSLMKVAA